MRAILCVVVCLFSAGCFDFEAELRECDAGRGLCARDGGGSDGGDSPDGGSAATADCAEATGATLLTPDGSVAFCFNGFAWENPLPHGASLQAVWGARPDDVWAGGAAGMLMHWNGLGWTSHQGVVGLEPFGRPRGSITSLIGSPSGTWLAGGDLYPHRLDDAGVWRPVTRSPDIGLAWQIEAMALSPDGQRGPFAVSRNGGVFAAPDWTRVSNSVGADYVGAIAVGDDGLVAFSGTKPAGSRSTHHVWNIDGGRWSFDAGESGPLWLEHGQLFVASTAREVPRMTLWELFPDGGATSRDSSDIDLVLSAAHFVPELDAGLLVGSAGRITDTWANTVLGLDEPWELRGVWVSPDGGSWAVGSGGALVHQEQAGWVARHQGFSEDQYGLWVAPDGGVYCSGRDSLITERATGARSRVGTGSLRALHRASDGKWLVASEDGNLYRSGSGTAVYRGPSSNNGLNDLLVDEDEAWAVGINTAAHRQADGGWVEEVPPQSGQEWWKISRAGSHVVVAGSAGFVAVYTLDAGWKTPVQQETEQASTFYGVWAIDAETAWVVGAGPSIRLFNIAMGSFEDWRPQSLQYFFGALYDVWGSAPNDVWAVGDFGMVMHFDGTEWTPMETGTRNMLERVRSRPLPGGGRELIIVGEKGTVLRKRY